MKRIFLFFTLLIMAEIVSAQTADSSKFTCGVNTILYARPNLSDCENRQPMLDEKKS